jgi:hypothetical protein
MSDSEDWFCVGATNGSWVEAWVFPATELARLAGGVDFTGFGAIDLEHFASALNADVGKAAAEGVPPKTIFIHTDFAEIDGARARSAVLKYESRAKWPGRKKWLMDWARGRFGAENLGGVPLVSRADGWRAQSVVAEGVGAWRARSEAKALRETTAGTAAEVARHRI